jgi:hypothetical protein
MEISTSQETGQTRMELSNGNARHAMAALLTHPVIIAEKCNIVIRKKGLKMIDK